MEHMLLQLKRTPEQERELQQFIDELTDSFSPNFHHWPTAKEFGERFGLARQDLDTVKRWLESHGFKVNVVYENGVLIDFSGTAGQVRAAFHTAIHQLNAKGAKHIANMSDPKIPSALAPAVAGVVSLHDFLPHAMYKQRTNYTFSYNGNEYYAVVPADLATIYNVNPLFNKGISGQGQMIVLIEDSDIYSATDWNTFRSTFGLSQYTNGSLTQIHPAPASGPNNCTDPGASGDDGEATLDVEYASAAAPSAAIELASCSNTTTFGGLIALQNVVNGSAPPAVVSMSYGECEAGNGASANAAYSAVYQQAVTEGVSIFVSSGDESAASCSYGEGYDTYGIGVSGFASTPYNVAVGGTDFGDTYAGSNSTYWNGTNTNTYGSALSYIPEIPWDDTCGSLLIAKYDGYTQTYGSAGFCNSSAGASFLNTTGGSGGPSGCATGTPSQSGVVGGSCAGWAKPSWQSLVGNPNDGVRDLPDVALFAANGVWGHYYPFCFTDPAEGGASCFGTPDTWSGAGGTSFASPIMAGFQALVNQKSGERQGNPNPTYYSLAGKEYGASGESSCNSTLGNTTGSSCIFYDVTLGDMNIPCVGPDCYQPSGNYGVLSTSTSACEPTNEIDGDCGAYIATTGWDFATGIGSVNVTNLVDNWPTSAPNFIVLSSPNTMTIAPSSSGTSTITITSVNGFSGSVTLSASGLPTGVTAAFSPNPATSNSTLTLTASAKAAKGTATVTITGTSGNLTNSIPISLTVAKPSFTLTASPSTVILEPGGSGTSAITINPVNAFSGNVTLTVSKLPAGVTAAFSPNPVTSGSVLTLMATKTSNLKTTTVTITGTSGSLSATTKITVTPGNFTLTATPPALTVVQGNSGTSTITISPEDGFDGNVTLSASKLPTGVTALFSPNLATSSSTLTLNVSDSAAIGKATITITGTSGSLVRTATIKLTTLLPNFTLAALPNALIITPGTSGTMTVTITPTNTFDQDVTLSASGLPDGVTASFSPNPATSSSTLRVAVGSSEKAVVGKKITITGTSGSLTHTATVELTVTR